MHSLPSLSRPRSRTLPHLSGALKDARPVTGTTLEEKIAARLADRKATGKGAVGKRSGGGRAAAADLEESEEDDSDALSTSDDSDAPLPGEEDESDSDDDEDGSDGPASSDEEEGEAAAVDEEDEDEDALPAAADTDDEEADAGAPALASSDDEEAPGAKAKATATRQKTDAGGAKHSAAAARAVEGGRVFDPAPSGTAFTASSFASLRLSKPLVKACAALGYARPTPIQVGMREREWREKPSFFSISSPHPPWLMKQNKKWFANSDSPLPTGAAPLQSFKHSKSPRDGHE